MDYSGVDTYIKLFYFPKYIKVRLTGRAKRVSGGLNKGGTFYEIECVFLFLKFKMWCRPSKINFVVKEKIKYYQL